MQARDTMVDVERTALLEFLERTRGNLRYTVQELTDGQARQRPTASELCLGGVVKHVATVERHWTEFIQEGAGGLDFSDPEVIADHVDGFELKEGETLAGVLEEYERVAEETARVVNALPDLEVRHALPVAPWWPEGSSWSARDVLLHVIAETAQHSGHADIIRETLDGQKTMGCPRAAPPRPRAPGAGRFACGGQSAAAKAAPMYAAPKPAPTEAAALAKARNQVFFSSRRRVS